MPSGGYWKASAPALSNSFSRARRTARTPSSIRPTASTAVLNSPRRRARTKPPESAQAGERRDDVVGLIDGQHVPGFGGHRHLPPRDRFPERQRLGDRKS